jgi:Zn-dependent oligopeptidase
LLVQEAVESEGDVLRRSGTMSLRQINFASTDLQLHARYTPVEGKTVFYSDIVKEVTAKTTVMPPLPDDRCVASRDVCSQGSTPCKSS